MTDHRQLPMDRLFIKLQKIADEAAERDNPLSLKAENQRLSSELDTLYAQNVYLERELAALKKHCDALTELLGQAYK